MNFDQAVDTDIGDMQIRMVKTTLSLPWASGANRGSIANAAESIIIFLHAMHPLSQKVMRAPSKSFLLMDTAHGGPFMTHSWSNICGIPRHDTVWIHFTSTSPLTVSIQIPTPSRRVTASIEIVNHVRLPKTSAFATSGAADLRCLSLSTRLLLRV